MSSAAIREGFCTAGTGMIANTTRTSWMANNAIPDSIIMNMIRRILIPPVESKVRSTEVINSATLRILNTIMPVTRVLMAKDVTNPVINNVIGQ